jgi:hypothetical protein
MCNIFARLRSQAGSAATSTGKIGTHAPCFSIPQLEQSPFRKQRQGLGGKTQLIPAKAAVDEEHLAVREARRAGSGANGIRGFTHKQRLIAGNQVDPGQASCQGRR